MSATIADLTTVLKLEVEAEPTGLVNLIQNPNGELGGWGWITPLSSSAMAGDSVNLKLTYSRSVAGASYFTSELLPIAAGQYAAASYTQQSAGNAYHRARFEWYDANKALLSSSAQTALTGPSGSATSFVAPVVAPASTAYFKLRFDLYTSGGANPTGAHSFGFTKGLGAVASSAGELATIRTNLFKNPSLETNAALWTTSAGTLTRSTTLSAYGGASLRLQSAAGAGDVSIYAPGGTSGAPVVPGQYYTTSCYIRAGATPAGWAWWVDWADAAGNSMGPLYGSATVVSTTSGWTRVYLTAQAPIGAAYARPFLYSTNPGLNQLHYFDGFLFEKGEIGPFFDGSTATAGTKTYAWTGTAHASTSTETDTQFFYFPPRTYLDVLGPTSEIKITRPSLDLGTMSAIVRDTALDPATATLLRPGQQVRLRALNATTAAYDVLFAGKALSAKVTYNLERTDEKQATISLLAVDPFTTVANTARPYGVATIPELPYVLEDAGVPWNCDGSGNQVPSATVVSSNDQASAVDQLVLARDTALGYAWITKEGVVTAYTSRTADYYGNGTAFLDESDYSAIDTSFDTEDCINEVLVRVLRLNAQTLETTEVAFGPFRDAASVKQWGQRQATFTVHGMADAAVPAYAAAILSANSTPGFRVNGLTIPIREPADITELKALLDLYAKVNVQNAAKGIDNDQRATTITHDISPGRWIMGLTFGGATAVSAPINTPTPDVNPVTDGVWITPTLANGWVNFGGGYATVQYMRKNGMVYVKGLAKSGTLNATIFTLPPGYRPAEHRNFASVTNSITTGAASAGTAHTHLVVGVGGRFSVNADGTVSLNSGTGSNALISLDDIHFLAEA